MKRQRLDFLFKDKDAFNLAIETETIYVRLKTPKESPDNHLKFGKFKVGPTIHG